MSSGWADISFDYIYGAAISIYRGGDFIDIQGNWRYDDADVNNDNRGRLKYNTRHHANLWNLDIPEAGDGRGRDRHCHIAYGGDGAGNNIRDKGKIPFEIFQSHRFDSTSGWHYRYLDRISDIDSLSCIFAGLPGHNEDNVGIRDVGGSIYTSGQSAESISFMTCFGFYLRHQQWWARIWGRKPERAEKPPGHPWAWYRNNGFVCGYFLCFFKSNPGNIHSRAGGNQKYFILSENPGSIADIYGIRNCARGSIRRRRLYSATNVRSIPGTLLRIPLAYYLAVNLAWGRLVYFGRSRYPLS